MNLEINKELVLSTAHIPGREGLALRDLVAAGTIDDLRDGWRVWTGYTDETVLRPTSKVSTVQKLLFLALGAGCKWLVLDQDGPDYPDELEVFDW